MRTIYKTRRVAAQQVVAVPRITAAAVVERSGAGGLRVRRAFIVST